MRLVQYRTPTVRRSLGVQRTDGSVVSAASILGSQTPANIPELLAAGDGVLDRLRSGTEAGGVDAAAEQVELLAPLSDGTLMVCAGANYRAHVLEMGDELPENAAWFIKNSNSIVGPGVPIELPVDAAEHVDWEGELCVVIGQECHAVSAGDAWDYIAGFTLLNDVSARDGIPAIQAARTGAEGRLAWTDMLLGKQYPTFAPLGPVVVTKDELPDVGKIRLTTTVNGRLMQDTLIEDLAVGIPELVEQFSRHFRFRPGDVISTGTPAGVGEGRKPQMYLTAGDVVTVAASGVGDLSNPVVAKTRPAS